MKIWTKVKLTDKNKDVEEIAILDQYTANRIAGILMLYLAKDTKRINDIVNKYHIRDGIIQDIMPELEGYIDR